MERIRQKLRTRRELLEAARRILAEGRVPSVAEAAERAQISRATAYRYFASQDDLLAEAPLDLDVPDVEDLFGSDAPTDAADRADRVREALWDFSVRNEREYRLFLRNAHDRALRGGDADGRRGGRRVEMLEEALAPLRDRGDEAELRRLIVALSALVGVESMLVQQDVLQVEREEAAAAFAWAARTLVEAVADAG